MSDKSERSHLDHGRYGCDREELGDVVPRRDGVVEVVFPVGDVGCEVGEEGEKRAGDGEEGCVPCGEADKPCAEELARQSEATSKTESTSVGGFVLADDVTTV